MLTQSFFLLSHLPNRHWWRAASASLGVSWSKSEFGDFMGRLFLHALLPLRYCRHTFKFSTKIFFLKSGERGCNLLLQVRLSSSSREMKRTPMGSSHLPAFFHSALNELLAGGKLLSPAVSYSVLIVSFSNTSHLLPSGLRYSTFPGPTFPPDTDSHL